MLAKTSSRTLSESFERAWMRVTVGVEPLVWPLSLWLHRLLNVSVVTCCHGVVNTIDPRREEVHTVSFIRNQNPVPFKSKLEDVIATL